MTLVHAARHGGTARRSCPEEASSFSGRSRPCSKPHSLSRDAAALGRSWERLVWLKLSTGREGALSRHTSRSPSRTLEARARTLVQPDNLASALSSLPRSLATLVPEEWTLVLIASPRSFLRGRKAGIVEELTVLPPDYPSLTLGLLSVSESLDLQQRRRRAGGLRVTNRWTFTERLVRYGPHVCLHVYLVKGNATSFVGNAVALPLLLIFFFSSFNFDPSLSLRRSNCCLPTSTL